MAGDPPAEIQLLGSNEIAAARGLLESDRIWAGSLLQAYRRPPSGSSIETRALGPDGKSLKLPVRLPAILEFGQTDGQGVSTPKPSGAAARATLIVTLAADTPTTVRVSAAGEEQSIQVGKGVSVRLVTVDTVGRVTLECSGGPHPSLLAAATRTVNGEKQAQEDYPAALVAMGESNLDGEEIKTRFTYLNVAVPAFHSIDLYSDGAPSHPGWFELPTYPDARLREIEFRLNPVSLSTSSSLDGQDAPRASSVRPTSDGQFLACFSVWSDGRQVKRIPIYSYRLEGGKIVDFRAWPLTAIWNGRFDSAALTQAPSEVPALSSEVQ